MTSATQLNLAFSTEIVHVAHMSKKIVLDDEAYRILKSRKLEGESFSDVVKKEMALALFGKELDQYLARKIGAKRKRKNGSPARRMTNDAITQ